MQSSNIDLWPAATSQNEGIPYAVLRFKKWKVTVSQLVSYIENEISTSRSASKGLSKVELDQDEVQAWIQFSRQQQSSFIAKDQQLEKIVLARLLALKSEIKSKSYDSDCDKLQKSVVKSRSAAYEMIQERSTPANTIQRSAADLLATNSTDPWLSERVFDQRLNSMIKNENQYQKDMIAIFEEMAVFDAHIIRELGTALVEYAEVEKSSWAAMQTQLDGIMASIATVDPSSYFATFADTHNLMKDEVWKKERTPDDFAIKAREIHIKRQGLLYRHSKLGMGMWVPIQVVVTETGFLHEFPLTSSQEKEFIAYFLTKDQSRTETANSLTIPREESTFDPETYFLETSKPEKSIYLGQPRLSVQQVVKKAPLHVFEITIQQRKKKLFSKDLTDSVTSYELKALSERDMMEWMAVIEHLAASMMPVGAPEPLQRAPKEIEQEVANLVAEHNAIEGTPVIAHVEKEAEKDGKLEEKMAEKLEDPNKTLENNGDPVKRDVLGQEIQTQESA